MSANVTFRPTAMADRDACARIILEAFNGIADQHNFPHDFPSLEVVTGFTQFLLGNPAIYGVAAISGGKVVGSNFLDERDAIRGVGPITIDPGFQGKGVGRKLMQAVIDRGRGAAGIRLVQDAFNTVSMSLYASLGFEVKEPLLLMRGKPKGEASGRSRARALTMGDVEACAELCERVHGFGRSHELRDAVGSGMCRPMGLFRDDRLAAYGSAPTIWPLNHGVAESERDMMDLWLAMGKAESEPLMFLLPNRQAGLLRWCLGAGMRVVKPMTLMAMGQYHEPRSAFYPSVAY